MGAPRISQLLVLVMVTALPVGMVACDFPADPVGDGGNPKAMVADASGVTKGVTVTDDVTGMRAYVVTVSSKSDDEETKVLASKSDWDGYADFDGGLPSYPEEFFAAGGTVVARYVYSLGAYEPEVTELSLDGIVAKVTGVEKTIEPGVIRDMKGFVVVVEVPAGMTVKDIDVQMEPQFNRVDVIYG